MDLGEIIRGGPHDPGMRPPTEERTNRFDKKMEENITREEKRQGRVLEKAIMNPLWIGYI